MTQYAYSTSDISTGTWGTTPLYGYIDEVTPADADNIRSGKNPVADTFECRFGVTITDPIVHTGHVLRIRIRDDKTNITGTFALYQGGTLIASQALSVTPSWAENTLNVSEAQAGNITDYEDLRVRVVVDGSANNYAYVSWARFETPDAGVPPVTFIGSVGSASNIPDAPLKRTREFVSVAVAGVSGIADASLKRLRGFVGETVAEVSGIVDVMLGRIRRFFGEVQPLNILQDGSFEEWADINTLIRWAKNGTGTITKETSDVVHLYAAVSGTRDAYLELIQTNRILEFSKSYVLEIRYKIDNAEKIAIFFRDMANNVWLHADGLWGANESLDLVGTGNWETYRLHFKSHDTYTLFGFWIIPFAGTFNWILDGFNIKKTSVQLSASLTKLKGFVGETVQGISSLVGDITVTAGAVVKAFIGAVGGISDVLGNITGTFSLSGSVGAVSGIADTVFKRLRKFVGVSIDVVSNIVDASLERIRRFIGTVGSLSGVDAVLKRIRRFTAPVITGISNIIAPLTKGAEVILQGVVGAISNIDANILVDYVLSGVTGAVSGVDGALGRVRTFIGTIGSLSGVDAVFGRVRKFVGETVQGISSILGNIQKGAIKAFIGTIGVISSIADAPLKILREFIGSIGSISGVSGALRVIYKFIGETVQGVSSVLGELSKFGTILLRGTIGAISAVDGVLKATFSLKGEVEGLSGVTGLMKYTASFSGLVEAISGLTGTIVTATTVVFQGVIGSFSNVIGDIKRSRGLTATISSLSGVDAVMKRIRAYIASVNVFSGVNGTLKRLRRLSGSLLSTTAVDGYVKILYRFIGSITSASIITATISRVKKFVGVTISAVSSVAGDLWAGVLYIFPIIFTVVPRVKAFLIEARDRIFKSNINKDR